MKTATHLRRQLFISLGLSDKEAFLLDMIFTHGTVNAAFLEKESSFKKNTYHLLKSLEEKKLVIKLKKDGKVAYQAQSPEILESLLKKQQQNLVQTQEFLQEMLPDLQSTYAMTVGKPTIRYYEGESGIYTIFCDIYAKKTEPVYGCVDLEKTDSVFPSHVLKNLIPLRVQNKLFAYSLVADSEQAREIQQKDPQQLRKTVLVDKEKYPLPAEIDVYEDKIAFLSFEKGSFIGTVIENKHFATTLKSVFKMIFDRQLQPEHKK